MKSFIKKALAILLAVLMLAAFCACGGSEPEPANEKPTNDGSLHKQDKSIGRDENSGKEQKKYQDEKITVTAPECIENGTQVILANTSTAVEVLQFGEKENVEWAVYLIDQKLTEPFESVRGDYEPSLTSAGRLKVTKGQYIYVCCSAKGEIPQSGDECPMLVFYGHGLSR